MIREIGRVGYGRVLALSVLVVSNLFLAVLLMADAPALADIVTPLTGHIIGLGLAAALGLALKGHVWKAMAAGLALTLSAHAWLGLTPTAAKDLPARVGTSQQHEQTRELTIISLNTWDATDNVRELEAYFKTAPADVVVLSELGPPKKHLLEALRTVYPYQKACAEEWQCSLALLSRIPFEQGGTVRWTRDMPAFVWARFAGSLTVVGTHISRPSRTPFLHARETKAVAQFVRRLDGSVVLVGDLNTSPWSYSFRNLKTQTGLTSSTLLTPSWPAWPVAVPQIALDHILVSSDISFAQSGTGPALGSDHLPVYAKLIRQPTTVRAREPVRAGASRLAATRPHFGAEFLADFGGEDGRPRYLRR